MKALKPSMNWVSMGSARLLLANTWATCGTTNTSSATTMTTANTETMAG